jgi:hypothetical protein
MPPRWRSRITISGSLAQKPGLAGHTWVFLNWVLGFRRLGYDVVFVDWLSPEMCGGRVEKSENVVYLRSVMREFGLADSFSLLDKSTGQAVAGLSREDVVRRARDSAFLLNVMGYLDDEEILGAATLRVFLDIDPGFGQMWCELGLANVFAGHDRFVTIGENIGRRDCAIPTCGLDWITTPQPIVLERWPVENGGGRSFTSVCTWRGAFGPIEFGRTTYGLRVHEFRKFAELPRLTGSPFELAVDIHDTDGEDRLVLERNGWKLVEPRSVASDPAAYRAYIAGSRAEFMVAKGMYVQTRSGWFSDRSICYLASGKPVLAQDTGLDDLYPTGEGLLLFATLEEAAAGVNEIVSHSDLHSRAARALAEEYFDSDAVLTRLLERLG